MQSTSNILMIKPVAFGFNAQTEGNTFQNDCSDEKIQEKALAEFNAFVNKLRLNHINVIVIEDTLAPHTPDSIFPNNWISFHNDGSVYIYPMQAENRRMERREDILDVLSTQFKITEINDLTFTEDRGQYLEGTGSMVLDRENKIAYACLSVRTHPKVLEIFCAEGGYRPLVFHAFDENDDAIYHTNVMMCIGDKFAVVCLESITDSSEKTRLTESLRNTGKELIEISLAQMKAFAGNMLEVKNTLSQNFIVMSESAFLSLNSEQKKRLSKHGNIICSPLETVEEVGGGSARCMMAEIHLEKKR